MGLMSFHRDKKLREYDHLLKSVDWYEEHQEWQLYFWTPEDSDKFQGIVGGEWNETENVFTVYDLALNPSMRGEGLGFVILNDLKAQYPNATIEGTKITREFIEQWQKTQD